MSKSPWQEASRISLHVYGMKKQSSSYDLYKSGSIKVQDIINCLSESIKIHDVEEPIMDDSVYFINDEDYIQNDEGYYN